jgi:hypothetical protein
MPGKSRHKRKKYSPQIGTGKSSQLSPTVPARPLTTTETPGPVSSRPRTLGPSARAAAQVQQPASVKYAYVATELRTIGILAGIMLVILIVLSIVLS